VIFLKIEFKKQTTFIFYENLIVKLRFGKKFTKNDQRNKKLLNFKVGPFFKWTVLNVKLSQNSNSTEPLELLAEP
jgi:chloramphenicol O-acetyltransferase